MIHNRKIAKRYAKAFTHAKMSEQEIDSLIDEMKSFLYALESDTRIKEYFESPVNPKSGKQKVLKDMGTKIGFSERFLSMIGVLVKKDRINLLRDVYDELMKHSDRLHDRIRVRVTTAYEPSTDDIGTIAGKISDYFGQNAIVERSINSSIIGGIVLEGDGKKIDMSVKGQLGRAFSK
jgi:F-type H+-transporting ATPase subunit delta